MWYREQQSLNFLFYLHIFWSSSTFSIHLEYFNQVIDQILLLFNILQFYMYVSDVIIFLIYIYTYIYCIIPVSQLSCLFFKLSVSYLVLFLLFFGNVCFRSKYWFWLFIPGTSKISFVPILLLFCYKCYLPWKACSQILNKLLFEKFWWGILAIFWKD